MTGTRTEHDGIGQDRIWRKWRRKLPDGRFYMALLVTAEPVGFRIQDEPNAFLWYLVKPVRPASNRAENEMELWAGSPFRREFEPWPPHHSRPLRQWVQASDLEADLVGGIVYPPPGFQGFSCPWHGRTMAYDRAERGYYCPKCDERSEEDASTAELSAEASK